MEQETEGGGVVVQEREDGRSQWDQEGRGLGTHEMEWTEKDGMGQGREGRKGGLEGMELEWNGRWWRTMVEGNNTGGRVDGLEHGGGGMGGGAWQHFRPLGSTEQPPRSARGRR